MGDRHLYASRTRFFPEALAAQFEAVVWPLATADGYGAQQSGSARIASPFIKPKPPSKKRRTFGPVTFEHMPGLEGRFSNLLRDKKNEAGTLH